MRDGKEAAIRRYPVYHHESAHLNEISTPMECGATSQLAFGLKYATEP